MRSPSLRALSISTVAAFCVSLSLVFFYAPIEAEEGFLQKIFYLHVPLAIVTLCGFVIGGLMAIAHLRTRDQRWDLRSYVAIHMSLIFGAGGAHHRLDLGAGFLGTLVGVERAHARLVPDHLPAVRHLPAAALRDRGPRAPGSLRLCVRDHRRGFRAAELPRRAPVRLLRASARARQLPRTCPLRWCSRSSCRSWRWPCCSPRCAPMSWPPSAPASCSKPARESSAFMTRWASNDLRRDTLPEHSNDGYVAAAYIVFFAIVLIYVAIMAVRLRPCGAQGTRDSTPTSAEKGARDGMSELLALGMSHKTAPVALRERLAFTESQAVEFAQQITESPEVSEAVVISTCNRTEIYLVVRWGSGTGRDRRARHARPARLDSSHRARPGDLLAAQLRGGAPALSRNRGPRVDDRRRGRDPGPGQARL